MKYKNKLSGEIVEAVADGGLEVELRKEGSEDTFTMQKVMFERSFERVEDLEQEQERTAREMDAPVMEGPADDKATTKYRHKTTGEEIELLTTEESMRAKPKVVMIRTKDRDRDFISRKLFEQFFEANFEAIEEYPLPEKYRPVVEEIRTFISTHQTCRWEAFLDGMVMTKKLLNYKIQLGRQYEEDRVLVKFFTGAQAFVIETDTPGWLKVPPKIKEHSGPKAVTDDTRQTHSSLWKYTFWYDGWYKTTKRPGLMCRAIEQWSIMVEVPGMVPIAKDEWGLPKDLCIAMMRIGFWRNDEVLKC